MGATRIEGACDSAFREVREVFADNFARFPERGACVSVVIEGHPVVDLWGGYRDADSHRPWEGDTVANVFSTTKGVATICLLKLVERGLLDLEAPMARYWPEFAAGGKGDVSVADCLGHRAGVPAVRETLAEETLYDAKAMGAAVAATEPWWEPGTRHGYHAVSFGWFATELVERLTGQRFGAFLHETFARPLEIQCAVGLPPEEDRRVADLVQAPRPEGYVDRLAEELAERPDSITSRALNNPPLPFQGFNGRTWRAAEIPAANGHANARALARLYGALAHRGQFGGVPVLDPGLTEIARQERSAGEDAVLWGIPTRFGVGFMLGQEERRLAFGPNTSSFGHPGMGGSVAFGDPEARLGFAYVMNALREELLIDERSSRLIDAVYGAL